MTLRRRELSEAATEFDAAVDWYAARRRVVALEFIDAVEAAIASIELWPDSGRPYPGREDRTPLIRSARVKGFPYRVVYAVDGGDLVVIAYAHDKQRPGYWTGRVEG